jgi:hypothetical protein
MERESELLSCELVRNTCTNGKSITFCTSDALANDMAANIVDCVCCSWS